MLIKKLTLLLLISTSLNGMETGQKNKTSWNGSCEKHCLAITCGMTGVCLNLYSEIRDTFPSVNAHSLLSNEPSTVTERHTGMLMTCIGLGFLFKELPSNTRHSCLCNRIKKLMKRKRTIPTPQTMETKKDQ